MIEELRECECGRTIEPAEKVLETDFLHTKFTEWFCECGRLFREHELITWSPAFYADVAKTRENFEYEKTLTHEQRKRRKRARFFAGHA